MAFPSQDIIHAVQSAHAVDLFFNKLLERGKQVIDKAARFTYSLEFNPKLEKLDNLLFFILESFTNSKSGYSRLVNSLFDKIRELQLKVFEGESGIYGHGPFEPLTTAYFAEKVDIIRDGQYLDGRPLNRNKYSNKYPFPPIMVLSGAVMASLLDRNDPDHIESVNRSERFFGAVVHLTMRFGTASKRAQQHAWRGIVQKSTGQLVKRNVLLNPEKQQTQEALEKIASDWLANINQLIEKRASKIK